MLKAQRDATAQFQQLVKGGPMPDVAADDDDLVSDGHVTSRTAIRRIRGQSQKQQHTCEP